MPELSAQNERAIHHYNRVLDHYEDKTRQVPQRVASGSHQEQYACGTRTVDKGNGFFSQETTYCSRTVTDYTTTYKTEHYQDPVYRQDPVYQTRYTYQVDRWVTERFEKASGVTSPYWPEPDSLSEKQRVGDERKQEYEVVLVDPKGREFTRDLDQGTWAYLSDGETIIGHQARSGTLREVDWPSS
jgi:hypothetical protein